MATKTARRPSKHALTPEQRAERLTEAREQLNAATDGLLTSEGWQQLIESRRWLQKYSLGNVLMILKQYPEATDVRPMSKWAEANGGEKPWMIKGTHRIKIWAPRIYKREVPGEDGGEDKTITGTSFILVDVVDRSQLQDPPAPLPEEVEPVLLTGSEPEGAWDALAALVEKEGYRIERAGADVLGSAKGHVVWADRVVRVLDSVEPAQAVKTLTHELAHILLEHETREGLSRSMQEVEAESVACVVLSLLGVDTLGYSVPYVAGWAGDRETVRASADRVLKIADVIVGGL